MRQVTLARALVMPLMCLVVQLPEPTRCLCFVGSYRNRGFFMEGFRTLQDRGCCGFRWKFPGGEVLALLACRLFASVLWSVVATDEWSLGSVLSRKDVNDWIPVWGFTVGRSHRRSFRITTEFLISRTSKSLQ